MEEKSSSGRGLLYILYYGVRLKEAILVEKSSSGQGVASYTVLRGTGERGNLSGKVQFWPGGLLYILYYGVRLKEAILVEKSSSGHGLLLSPLSSGS